MSGRPSTPRATASSASDSKTAPATRTSSAAAHHGAYASCTLRQRGRRGVSRRRRCSGVGRGRHALGRQRGGDEDSLAAAGHAAARLLREAREAAAEDGVQQLVRLVQHLRCEGRCGKRKACILTPLKPLAALRYEAIRGGGRASMRVPCVRSCPSSDRSARRPGVPTSSIGLLRRSASTCRWMFAPPIACAT